MEPFSFPPATLGDEDSGLIGVGANWHPETIIDAYSKGIFPWPHSDLKQIPWFSPPNRAILDISQYNPNKRLLRELRKSDFTFTSDLNFSGVIHACKNTKRKEYLGNSYSSWITEEMIQAYIKLNELKIAHSIEVSFEGELVGGIYGVLVKNIFSAESMFRTKNNASKAAFHALVGVLDKMGLKYLDCQILSPHLSSWGVKEIVRDEFLNLIEDCEIMQYQFPKGDVKINSYKEVKKGPID